MESLQLEDLKKELECWLKHESVNNIGQFARKIKIDSLKEQITKVEQSKALDNSKKCQIITGNSVLYDKEK